jgi:hypothetical protein
MSTLRDLLQQAVTELIKNDPALMTALQRSAQDIEEERTHCARKVFDDIGW